MLGGVASQPDLMSIPDPTQGMLPGMEQPQAAPAPQGYFQLTCDLKPTNPLYDMIKSRLSARMKIAESEQEKHHQRWSDAEDRVLAYIPESDADARRKARRKGGEPTYTTIQVPYTFAQTMAAHTYWTSVFLSRNPVHQVTGRHGEGEMQIQAVEALLAYQLDVGQALAPYFLWFYDAAKYGEGWLGSYWDEERIQYTTIEEVPDERNPEKTQKVQVTRRVDGYSGNKHYNISPFDAFPDPRVTAGNYQKGEFFAVRCRLMWNELVRRAKRGMYTNVDMLRGTHHQMDKTMGEGSSNLERPIADWSMDTFNQLPHPAVVPVYEIYVDLIPEEWGLGGTDWPEKWVFTMTTDHETIIGAQPLGAVHGQFPVSLLEPEIESYGTHNRGIPETQAPIQDTMDWLLNSHMFNVRATLNNGYIIDPTKIVMKDVEKGGAGFVWRLRPEAFGQDIDTFYKQVQINDVTGNHMTDLQTMFGIGERIYGINVQILGMMQSTGRKTATEVRTSTGFGVNRLKTNAEYMSAAGFAPHTQRLIQTSQQFDSAERKLRLVGDLANMAGPGFLDVSPESILGQYDFVGVDGTLPIDRFAQLTLWKELIANIAQIPQIIMQYDLGKIFGWMAQMGGIKNLDRFKIQQGSPEQLMAQAQAGNIIPINGPGGSGATNVGAASAGGSAKATGGVA